MYIKNLHQELRDATATITLSYDEVNALSNLLYEANVKEKPPSYKINHLYKDFYILSRLLKDGCLDDWDIEHMNQTVNEIQEKEEDE